MEVDRCRDDSSKKIGTTPKPHINALNVETDELLSGDSSRSSNTMELHPCPFASVLEADQLKDRDKIPDEFVMKANELENWISQHSQMAKFPTLTDLHSEIEKHKIFEAELIVRMKNIKALDSLAIQLTGRHQTTSWIQTRLDHVHKRMETLLALFVEKGFILKETTMFNQFQNAYKKMLAWIEDMDAFIRVYDFGVPINDFKWLKLKMEKCVEVQTEMKIHEHDLLEMNYYADTLISYGHENQQNIQEKRGKVNDNWKILKEAVEGMVKMLEMQRFSWAVDETMALIDVNALKFSEDVFAKDLREVRVLICETEKLEGDLFRIQSKMSMLGSETERLCKLDVYLAEKVREKYANLSNKWDRGKLFNKLQIRKSELEERCAFECQQLLKWISDMRRQISVGEIPKDVDESKVLLEKYDSLKKTVDEKEICFKCLNDIAECLVATMHSHSNDVVENIKNLDEQKTDMEFQLSSWKTSFVEYLDFQIAFREYQSKYKI